MDSANYEITMNYYNKVTLLEKFLEDTFQTVFELVKDYSSYIRWKLVQLTSECYSQFTAELCTWLILENVSDNPR